MRATMIILATLTTFAIGAKLEAGEAKELKPIKRTVVYDAGDGTVITWNGAGWSQK